MKREWSKDGDIHSLANNVILNSWEPTDEHTITEVKDPRLLAAKSASSKYNKDNPSCDTATRGPFQQEFWQAMREELDTLTKKFDCWSLVKRTSEMNVLPSTWAFKITRYPDGSVKKFKARFRARGDCQKEGVDYFETWAPIVHWKMIRIIMVLAAKLGLVLVQCDITATFIHGQVPDHEHIYVHQPRGFYKGGKDNVLKLKHTLYGLKQSPRFFFKYFSDQLIAQELTPSQFDPCLFLSTMLIVVIYVDDILIYGKTESVIDKFIENMTERSIALHKEGTAEDYLGVNIKRDGRKIIFTQEGLVRQIIQAIGLDTKYSMQKKCRQQLRLLERTWTVLQQKG